jgi:cytochrome c oxidase assembly factor CtaG
MTENMTIVVSLVATGLIYAWGVVRAARRKLAPRPSAIVAFVLGLVVAAAVLLPPFDDLADASLAWHMAQHLALGFIIAPLVLLGAPLRVALAALPARAATAFARALNAAPLRVLTQPAVAWLQAMAVLYVVHFSPLYEAALEHEPVHALEHALFLASGLIFWTPVLAVAPAPHAPPHIVRILMLFLALPISGFLGFIFYVARTPLYAHYAALPNALADQQNAGAVMWIAGGAPLFVALLWCVADWGARERRLGALADRFGPTT